MVTDIIDARNRFSLRGDRATDHRLMLLARRAVVSRGRAGLRAPTPAANDPAPVAA